MAIEPCGQNGSFWLGCAGNRCHDIQEINDAFYRPLIMPRGKPILIIAHTVKGRGIEDTEFNYKWHTQHPSPQEADQMLRELAVRYGKPVEGYSRLKR